MSHNSHFHPEHEPFRHEDELQLQHSRVHGPLSFLNPTRAEFKHNGFPQKASAQTTGGSASEEEKQYPSNAPASDVSFLWRSRDNRKGRHALLVEPVAKEEEAKYLTPARTNTFSAIAKNVKRMFTYFPVWDISYVIAVFFTIGSAVWVINAFFSWLPLVKPSSAFNGELLYGGGVTAFIGAVVFFETGSILLLFEAINENNTGCFGWAIEGLFDEENSDGRDGKGPMPRIKPERQNCQHHHRNRRNFVGSSVASIASEHKEANENDKGAKTWQWWPSWHTLRTHYFHEIGFLAGLAQFLGATIFSIAGFTVSLSLFLSPSLPVYLCDPRTPPYYFLSIQPSNSYNTPVELTQPK